MKKSIFMALAIACSFALSSCGPSRYAVAERPAEPYYERPVAPGPNYVWVDGDWAWQSNRYVYRRGYWTAPRGNRHWQTGRWQQSNKGWQWQHGGWRR